VREGLTETLPGEMLDLRIGRNCCCITSASSAEGEVESPGKVEDVKVEVEVVVVGVVVEMDSISKDDKEMGDAC
jgi:hypothetical protein